MTISYSFSFVIKSSHIDELLQQIANNLSNKDSLRLQAALPWKPAIERYAIWGSGDPVRNSQGIGGLQLEGCEEPNHYCFSFLFEPDQQLEESEFFPAQQKIIKLRFFPNNLGYFPNLFEPDLNTKEYMDFENPELENGKCRVGCIWTTLFVGSEYSWLELTSWVRDISQLFSSSPSIRTVMREIAKNSSAEALFFDEEETDWLLLYPEERKAPTPWEYYLFGPDWEHFITDAFCMEALVFANLG